MSQPPYQSANRVFWIMDNCSAHRGQKAVQRLRSQWPNVILVHTPTHASWLNQVEIYFSIVQRKVLTPNDFSCLAQLEQRLLDFQKHYEQTASPFKWRFTRNHLVNLLAKLQQKTAELANPDSFVNDKGRCRQSDVRHGRDIGSTQIPRDRNSEAIINRVLQFLFAPDVSLRRLDGSVSEQKAARGSEHSE